MPLGRERRYYLKLKAAYYCYEKGCSQTDVAQMLGISRPTLGKLLTEAKEEGIVRVQVADPLNFKHILYLEDALKKKFSLQDVRILNTVVAEDDNLTVKLAEVAAEYVDENVYSGIRIASGWGYTLEMMSQFIKPNPVVKDIEVYTLMGGAGTADSVRQPDIIARQMLNKFSGTGHIINALYVCQSENLCAALKREPAIAEVIEKSREADLTLVGIGEKPSADRGYIDRYAYGEEAVKQLEAAGACGDICAHFFDRNGELCDSPLRGRIVGIDINDLHAHKKVVGIGGGVRKHEAVLGALRGGYLDVLITDRFTAEAALEAEK